MRLRLAKFFAMPSGKKVPPPTTGLLLSRSRRPLKGRSPSQPSTSRHPHSPLPQTHPQHRNTVHFPPSPTLTRTFSARSPSTYDRSPIVVLPNICALPARGCPGRTYIPGCITPNPSGSPDSQNTFWGQAHASSSRPWFSDRSRSHP